VGLQRVIGQDQATGLPVVAGLNASVQKLSIRFSMDVLAKWVIWRLSDPYQAGDLCDCSRRSAVSEGIFEARAGLPEPPCAKTQDCVLMSWCRHACQDARDIRVAAPTHSHCAFAHCTSPTPTPQKQRCCTETWKTPVPAPLQCSAVPPTYMRRPPD
jgi:hypothetical protein